MDTQTLGPHAIHVEWVGTPSHMSHIQRPMAKDLGAIEATHVTIMAKNKLLSDVKSVMACSLFLCSSKKPEQESRASKNQEGKKCWL